MDLQAVKTPGVAAGLLAPAAFRVFLAGIAYMIGCCAWLWRVTP
jgi:hypothetical protein